MSRRLRLFAHMAAFLLASTLLPAAAWAEFEVPTYTVTGTYTTNMGTPRPETGSVSAYDMSADRVADDLLDADGSYSLDLPEGTYNFEFGAVTGESPELGYGEPQVITTRRNVEVSADMRLDVFDDEPALTVHLQDSEGNPESGMVLLACAEYADDWPAHEGDPLRLEHYSDQFAKGTGDLIVHGFPITPNPEWENGCKLTVYPDQGTYQYFDVTLSETEPNELTVTVPDPVTVTGHVSTPDGSTFGAYVYASDAQGRAMRVAEPYVVDGDYRMLISPGTYDFHFQVSPQELPSEEMLLSTRGVEVSEDMTLDGSIDSVPVKVNMVDLNGDPVAGGAEMRCEEEPPPGTQYSQSYLASPAYGTGEVTVAGVPESETWKYCRLGYEAPDADSPQYGLPGNPVTVDPEGPNEFTVVAPDGPVITGGFHASNDPDGVEDIIEAGAPNFGDGNADSVPDFEQDHVASLPANGQGRSEGVPYVTVAGPVGSKLTGVTTMDPADAASAPPAGVTLPSGLTSFVLDDIAPGSTHTVSVWMGSVEGVNGYAKYDPDTGTWTTLPAERVAVVVGISNPHIDITLTDGGIGDADGTANGEIADPGGYAKVTETGDTTPPTVTGRATTRPNAAGWYRTNVRVDWSATDEGSGVATQPPDTTVSTQGADVTATSPLTCDKAPTANCARGTLSGLKIDKTAPSVDVTGVSDGATYTLGAAPVPGCGAADALSGLVRPCAGSRFGGNSNGVGTFTYAATATDRAGNTRVVSASYRVVYRFDGFAQPLNDPGPPMSVFRAGSTVPVAFTLKRSNGTSVTPVSKPTWVTPVRGARTTAPVNEPVSAVKGTTGTSFVFKNGRWNFDWSTKGLSAGYVYRIGVRLDDGTTHHLNVAIR